LLVGVYLLLQQLNLLLLFSQGFLVRLVNFLVLGVRLFQLINARILFVELLPLLYHQFFQLVELLITDFGPGGGGKYKG